MESILDKLEAMEKRYEELNQLMAQSSVAVDHEQWQSFGQEQASLQEPVSKFRKYRKTLQELEEAQQLLDDGADPEMMALVKQEVEDLEERRDNLMHELKMSFLTQDPADKKNAIVEIRAGTGGDEATLFAGDLYRMYARYAQNRGWDVEVIDSSQSERGGFKEIIFEARGKGTYSKLKYERGVHRVQRVPVTEASGRIHTSTATVVVLPEAEDVEVNIKQDELRIDIFHSGGPGGQNVNKVATAVRITHVPTGIVVVCQDDRSQLRNRTKAMAVLRARIFDIEQRKQQDEITRERRSQVGTAERSEKIRTYNYPQNRVTDHRIGLTLHNLPAILQGELDELMPPRRRQRSWGKLQVSLKDELRKAENAFTSHHIDDARIEAELLLMHILGVGRAELYTRLDEPLPPSAMERFWYSVQNRLCHEPTAYILKQCQFYGLDLYIDSRALIPRPETELLVEEVLKFANRHFSSESPFSIAEVGTGSGAIAIAIALHLPGAEIYATDISADALEVARINCQKYKVTEKVHLLLGDMLQPLSESVNIILANLPYVRDGEMDSLSPEIREFEPGIALAGGVDGLDKIRLLLPQARQKILPGGLVLLEIGYGQSAAVTTLIEDYFPSAKVDLIPDLAGIERVVRVESK